MIQLVFSKAEQFQSGTEALQNLQGTNWCSSVGPGRSCENYVRASLLPFSLHWCSAPCPELRCPEDHQQVTDAAHPAVSDAYFFSLCCITLHGSGSDHPQTHCESGRSPLPLICARAPLGNPTSRCGGARLPPWACAQWKETRRDCNVLAKSVNFCLAGIQDNSLLWNSRHIWEGSINPPIPIKANGLRSATLKFAMNFMCACSHLFSH